MPKPVIKPIQKTYFIGLDMSLNGTGYAVIEHPGNATGHWLSNFSVMDIGTIKIAKGDVGPKRLWHIRAELDRIFSNYYPQCVAIEGYAHGSRFQAHPLGEVGGIARLRMYDRGIMYHNVAPKSLKKYMMGEGGGASSKAQILKAMRNRWKTALGVNVIEDDNQADALGLATVACLMDAPRVRGVMDAGEMAFLDGLKCAY